MKSVRGRVSTGRLREATRALLLGSLLAGCGGGGLPVVLREGAALRHLPPGTRIAVPERRAFEIEAPEGGWLVSAAYLSRIHELLGRPSPD